MPFSQYLEPRILDQLFGNCIGQINQTITAPAAATTTITVRGSAGSGTIDVSPTAQYVLFATPGSGATQNQYTNLDIVLVNTTTAGITLNITSQTIGKSRAVGDFIFLLGTVSAFAPVVLPNTVYVGLSTVGAATTVAAGSDIVALPTGTINVVAVTGAGSTFPAGGGTIMVDTSNGLQAVAYTACSGTTFTGCTGGTGIMDTGSVVTLVPTAATVLSNEPSATGGYARVAMLNNPANFPAASGSEPATKTTGTAVTFPASTAAWSTGATALDLFFVADASTLGGGNVLFWGPLGTPQTVNAAGITPSFIAGASGLALTLS